MPANKEKKTGKWNCTFYYTDWTGKKIKKMKRGFATKGEALDWERHFLLEKASSLDMTFGDFNKRYKEDVQPKVRENTWRSKEYVIEQKILPYFKDLVMREITPRDILTWQNEMRSLSTSDGNSFSGTYLRTMQAQLSAIFNHAVKYYELPRNPAVLAGPLGQHHADEMLFWTKDEYMTFIPAMANKTYSYMAFRSVFVTLIKCEKYECLIYLTVNIVINVLLMFQPNSMLVIWTAGISTIISLSLLLNIAVWWVISKRSFDECKHI